MPEFHYDVIIDTEREEDADKVMAERLAPDEDYGFEYEVKYGHRTASGRLLTEADFERLADEAEQGSQSVLAPLTFKQLRANQLTAQVQNGAYELMTEHGFSLERVKELAERGLRV